MSDDLTTKPTIETVLERISAFEKRFESRFDLHEKQVAARFDQLESRLDRHEKRFDQLESRGVEQFEKLYNEIDRVASVAHSTKAEMSTLRVEFRELRSQLKEVLPIAQAS